MMQLAERQTELYGRDGWDALALAEPALGPAPGAVNRAIDGGDWAGFEATYSRLVASCNGCNASTDYGYVVIPVSRQPTYRNQKFGEPGAVAEPAPARP